MVSEGYRINTVDVRTLGASGMAQLKGKGVNSLPGMIYYSQGGSSDPRVYNGWSSKANLRKMFDHTRDLEVATNTVQDSAQ